MASLAGVIGGVVIQGAGQEKASQTTQAGVETQADIEGLNREFQSDLFDKQIERQQPFVDVGNLALPEFINAIHNQGDASGLPAATLRRDIVGEFLGEQAPEFVRENAFADINAVETEANKGRLSDLVNIGLGGAGNVARTGTGLTTNISNSIAGEGNLIAQGLQDQAASRQNISENTVNQLSALPALIAASRGGATKNNNISNTGLVLGSGQDYRGYA